tara:strand:+ start:1836 stop:2141 length:306 start_codon:yes stop_codon:yes gene_type:complete
MSNNKHEETLGQINLAVDEVIKDIRERPKASDKSLLANALKSLLECRRIEELMLTRSTIQELLSNVMASGTDIVDEKDLASDFFDDIEDATLINNENENLS